MADNNNTTQEVVNQVLTHYKPQTVITTPPVWEEPRTTPVLQEPVKNLQLKQTNPQNQSNNAGRWFWTGTYASDDNDFFLWSEYPPPPKRPTVHPVNIQYMRCNKGENANRFFWKGQWPPGIDGKSKTFFRWCDEEINETPKLKMSMLTPKTIPIGSPPPQRYQRIADTTKKGY